MREADEVRSEQAGGDHFILMYHHVGSVTQLSGLAPFVVSPANFKQQLDSIASRGLKVEPLTELLTGSRVGERQRPSVVLTFDDCSAGLFDFAIPELEHRGWKATFFATAGKVGEYNDWDRAPGAQRVRLMDWEHLRELASRGHEIGAHGFSHSSLRDCSDDDALVEMVEAREVLEQGTGARVRTFAYPFGDIPDGYPSLCRDADYQAACSIFSTSSRVLGDPFAVRRILVTDRDAGLRIRAKLSRLYLRVRARVVDPRVLRRSATRPRLEVDNTRRRNEHGTSRKRR
jgi:peptidoglycan/xylan/chitin deacetylase (PgdA/CDA1 family)